MKPIETITQAVLDMEKERLTLAQFKLVQKLRYYVNKYNTEVAQLTTENNKK